MNMDMDDSVTGSVPLLSPVRTASRKSLVVDKKKKKKKRKCIMTMSSPVTTRPWGRSAAYHEYDDVDPYKSALDDDNDGYTVGGYVVKRRHDESRSHPWKKPSSDRQGNSSAAARWYREAQNKQQQQSSATTTPPRRVSPPPSVVSPPTTTSRDPYANAPKYRETAASLPPPPPPPVTTPPTPASPLHDRYHIQGGAASPSPRRKNTRSQPPPAEPLEAECRWVDGEGRTSPPSTPPRPNSRDIYHRPQVTPQSDHRRRDFQDEFLKNYSSITQEPAYRHAQNAGVLWQTLVGQHVKFPRHWWNGARSPSMGCAGGGGGSGNMYNYIARHRVYSNPTFMALVKHRGSSGRILLHVVIRSSQTSRAVQDVVIGCFHPNARGIRATPEADPAEEECRMIYMATRKRLQVDDDVSDIIDPLLTRGRSLEELANESPLGEKKWVSNLNMREVFGDKPPLQTVFITEIQLDSIMVAAEEQNSFAAPALVLLREYLFP